VCWQSSLQAPWMRSSTADGHHGQLSLEHRRRGCRRWSARTPPLGKTTHEIGGGVRCGAHCHHQIQHHLLLLQRAQRAFAFDATPPLMLLAIRICWTCGSTAISSGRGTNPGAMCKLFQHPAACTVQVVKMFGSMQTYRLPSNRFTFDLEKERE
jgi:hypothetical protein